MDHAFEAPVDFNRPSSDTIGDYLPPEFEDDDENRGAGSIRGSEDMGSSAKGMNTEENSICGISGQSASSSDHPTGALTENTNHPGEIEFAINYDFRLSVFRVSVKRCRHLNGSIYGISICNPFVKVILLPDKTRRGKRKTKFKKQTNDPEFHEDFKYFIEKSALESRSLLVTVWHKSEILTGNKFLGEVSIPLDFYEFNSMEPQWYLLNEQSPNVILKGNIVYRGDINVAIKYVTPQNVNITDLGKLRSKGELLVWIKGAKNLSLPNISRESNPIVKMFLLPDTTKLTKRKSPIARRTNDPNWNVILKYENIPHHILIDRGLEISVWNRERFGGKTFLGGVRLNLGPGDPERVDIDWMDASGPEFRLWSGVMSFPNVWIDGSLPLRPYLD